MALDASLEDPCSILNATGYPTLWLKTGSTTESDNIAYPKIATSGVTNTYLGTLTATGMNLSTDALITKQATSQFRLLQFMSAGGIAAGAKNANGDDIRYDQLSGLALRTGTTYESIVDTYIVSTKGLGKTGYKYPKQGVPALTDLEIWTPADATTEAKVSLLGKLIKEGYLLSASELFTQSQLTASTNPIAGTESLIYLYRQDQSSTPLTSEQRLRKATLEARNLRFFGAFLCEYCFYRTRYEWLLSKYFTVYNTPLATSTSANKFSFPADSMALFSGTGSEDNQYATGTPTQADLLKALAYHMACLNTRMTDMRRLLGAINTYYNGVFTSIQTSLNSADIVGSNSELTKTIQALQMSANDSNSYLSQTEFTKSVMEYNSEKNRYSNILLGLYAFLNIAALATVFQLARSP